MTMTRRSAVRATAALAAGLLATRAFSQDTSATRALSIYVPTPAGGMIDALGRLLAQELTGPLGRPVVVENRAGANTMIATQAVARAPADGSSVLINSAQVVMNPLLYQKPGYDAFKDLVPVVRIGSTVTVLTIRADPATPDLKAFLAKVKARGSAAAVSYGTQGIGSSHHIYTEVLARQAGLSLNHIPYKGEAPMVPDLLSGRIDMGWLSVMGALQYATDGKAQLLAATGKKRSAALPQVPTFAELGYTGGLDTEGWFGLFAPAGTPPATVDRLAREVTRLVTVPAVRARLVSFGIDPVVNTPAEFGRFLRQSNDDWAAMIKTSGVTVE